MKSAPNPHAQRQLMCSQSACALQIWPSAQPSLHKSSQNRVGKCTNTSENKVACMKCLIFYVCEYATWVILFPSLKITLQTEYWGFIAKKFTAVLCWRGCSGMNYSLVSWYSGHSHRYQLQTEILSQKLSGPSDGTRVY